MGKNKAKGDGGMKKPQNVNTVPNRDIMQRMNFLWQASVYLESLGGGGSGCGVMKEEEVGEEERGLVEKKKNIPNVTRKGVGRKRKWKMVDGPDLARVYIRTMKSVGQKTTTKMDPAVKRTVCKGCSSVLVPGLSARVRTRPSVQFGHWMAYTCLECSTTRRIPAPRNTPDEPSTILSTSLRLKGRADDTADNTYEPLTQEAEGTTRSTEHEGIPKHYGTKRGRRNRKKNAVRGQSLSARRSAGHVVFMGAEEVDMEGVYCA